MSKMAASIPECVQTTKEGVSGLQKDKEVMSNVEKVAPETARKSISSFDHGVCHTEVSAPTDDSESTGVHVCEVCGTCFETRRGLSSHARSHLRQLGVAVSDSSGAPIDLLYQLIKERDGQLPYPLPQSSPAVKLQPKIPSPKKDTGTKLKIKISNLVKKKYTKSSFVPKTPKESTPAGSPSHFSLSKPRSSSPVVKKVQISTLPPASSPLSAMDSKLSAGSPSASTSLASAKPLWAPQETDAPLNLTMMDASSRDDVHVCEMCGAWFETRKGLSSHARAHLRHFGVVNVDAKGAPIELLHQILRSKDFQDRDGAVELDNLSALEGDSSVLSTSSISSKRTSISSSTSNGFVSSPLLPPSTKKLKLSPERSGSEEFSFTRSPGKKSEKKSSHGGASKDLRCEFCQETFKKSQSLASHARSHLRQLGITEWTVRGSPMATLREVIASRGISGPLKPPTDLPLPSPPSSSSSPPNLPKHSSTPVPHKVPKARKGSRLVSKPKDEPLEMDISVVGPPGSHAICTPPATAPNWSNSSSLQNVQSPHSAPKPEQDTLQVVSCEYCGELFDSRKALSCHARSHLRQLGVRWSVNCSPLDTLLELMRREGRYQGSGVKLEPGSGTSLNYGNSAGTAGQWRKPASSPRAFTPSPVDFSLKEKPTSESATAQSACDATCELCGFDFENRKALASHARAHLRQLGVEWRINGSPIETLSIWMQNEPSKVAELHKRYMQGDLPHIRRRSTSSPCASTDPESWRAGTLRVPLTPRLSQGVPQGQQVARSIAAVISGSSASESRADMSHSSHKKHMTQGTSQPTHGLQQSPVARSELNVRLPRGCERRPPKHLSHTESRVREARPSKPPRYGNIPSLVPRPPATSLVKLVGKVYSLKCRFCEEVFRGPLCVQEDWIMHLQKHILQLKRDSSTATQTNPSPGLAHHAVSMTTVSPPLIAPQAV